MFRTKLTFKTILISLGLMAGLVWLAIFSFPDSKLHLVFCDVGQGDAILITQGFNQILIDGGPDDKVLTCLKNNLPFFDRKIEIIALTHPEADHLTGLISVLDKYSVDYFLMGPEGNETAVFQKLISNLKTPARLASPGEAGRQISKPRLAGGQANLKSKNYGIKVINRYTGDKIKIGGIILDTWWPKREWVAEKLGADSVILSGALPPKNPDGILRSAQDDTGNYQASNITANGNKTNILGFSSANLPLNQFSLIFLLSYQGKKVLLMGDGDSKIQKDIMENNTLLPIDILKFPHHGSKTGISEQFLELIQPKEAVISVGKNSYGHPTNEAMEMLRKVGARIRRTDLEGEIKYNF